MHVVLVEPAFPRNQRQFARALAAAGARVTGVGERSLDDLDDELKGWLWSYERVGSVVDVQALADGVRRAAHRGPVERLEATVESHVLPAARVREAFGIPGTSTHTAWLCRDKPAMKDALRAAGVPCARSTGTDDPAAVRAFAREVGYPLILKPRDAAGAAGTWRADDDAGLERALEAAGVGHGASVAVEEFIEGHEGFYDTVCAGGRVVHDFVSHYYPGVLEAMRTRWISPQVVATNRTDAESYGELRALGQRVIEALGIGTSATHMEWFFGPKGLVFSEIGCRPPGVGAWDLYCAANELDLYGEWARLVVQGRTDGRPSRRYSAGMIALRPDRDGRVARYEGVEEVFQRYGDLVIDSHFPEPGTPTQPVEAGYMANAWMRLRHPDYDELRGVLDDVGRTVQVRAD